MADHNKKQNKKVVDAAIDVIAYSKGLVDRYSDDTHEWLDAFARMRRITQESEQALEMEEEEEEEQVQQNEQTGDVGEGD